MAATFDVLFLTDFSDYAFRSVAFLAQLCDAAPVRLTLMHGCADQQRPHAEHELKSFCPEAERLAPTERRVVPGDVVQAAQRLQQARPFELVVAPGSDGLLWPKPLRRSTRARLLRTLRVPLWSIGPATDPTKVGVRPRTIVCWVDLGATSHRQLPYALELAEVFGAKLHLMCALPEPSLHAALIPDLPLNPAVAASRVLAWAGPRGATAGVHVLEQDKRGFRRDGLAHLDADLLFAPFTASPVMELLGARPSWLREASCPVVLVPEDPTPAEWSLSHRPLPQEPRALAFGRFEQRRRLNDEA